MKDASSPAEAVLYVVATPIGNMDDISVRALSTLAAVDCIVAEDTRVTRRLLDRHGIATPVHSLHSHNEEAATRRVMARLESGASVALVSDAGTPLLSDPGFELVARAREAGVAVRPIPGPSAITAALSVAGLPGTRFWFEGFLPPRGDARRARLAQLRGVPGTLVFFEAPHRVRETLEDLIGCFGAQADAAFARELTKVFEEVRRDTLESLREHFREHAPRGEFVLLVSNPGPGEPGEEALRAVLEPLLGHLPTRKAAALAAQLTGARRNRVYELALALKGEGRGS